MYYVGAILPYKVCPPPARDLHEVEPGPRQHVGTNNALSISRYLLHLGLLVRVPLYRIPLTANHHQLRLLWAHEHRDWQAD